MNDRHKITVRDVFERHDCSGKKTVDITALEEDEIVSSRFRLTKAYMFSHDKLMLGTVSPMDEAEVVIDEFPSSPIVVGEYIGNYSDVNTRHPICRCGEPLISDGFDIYCTNDQCGLTLHSKLERLGSTEFFSFQLSGLHGYDKDTVIITDDPGFTHPFNLLLKPQLWGEGIGSLEAALLKKKPCNISLATFLVEPLFADFIDCINPLQPWLDKTMFQNISHFFGSMDEIIARRDYSNARQNKLIKEFIWSLGIEALKEDVINTMVTYEQSLGWMEDVMVPYAYMLSHPKEMVKELGLHPLEATSITAEFKRRKYEFIDIFSHYSSVGAMGEVFSDIW